MIWKKKSLIACFFPLPTKKHNDSTQNTIKNIPHGIWKLYLRLSPIHKWLPWLDEALGARVRCLFTSAKMFNQPIEAKQEKTVGPTHFYNHTQEYQSPQTAVPNNPLELNTNGAPWILHGVPCGEPTDQEPAAPWAVTSGILRPGSKWGVRRDRHSCKCPFLHLETGCWGMVPPRWMGTKGMASQIDNQRILTLEGTSGAQRSELTSTKSHS